MNSPWIFLQPHPSTGIPSGYWYYAEGQQALYFQHSHYHALPEYHVSDDQVPHFPQTQLHNLGRLKAAFGQNLSHWKYQDKGEDVAPAKQGRSCKECYPSKRPKFNAFRRDVSQRLTNSYQRASYTNNTHDNEMQHIAGMFNGLSLHKGFGSPGEVDSSRSNTTFEEPEEDSTQNNWEGPGVVPRLEAALALDKLGDIESDRIRALHNIFSRAGDPSLDPSESVAMYWHVAERAQRIFDKLGEGQA
ncbi:hypothetical protein CC80DRAFT_555062 [Byssothecium circinans]|uniref:Uncharacterized protein n=1 Tax=Byssothecium circinans TaxID=147558 RepID=A0A6A5TBN2_9PLEO|nr:hypothetical protein CC80DRAFT_555062 [Byssothecium circinans]